MSGPRHIKFSLCVRLQKYLKVRSDSHLSLKMTIVIVTNDLKAAFLLHYNSLPCGTECCSRMAARPGQRLRKKDIYCWP